MKFIKLHNSPHAAMVDDGDFHQLSKINWYEGWGKSNSIPYPSAHIKTGSGWRHIQMHKMLCCADRVDHKDRNPLNNQRNNLRPADVFKNAWNTGPKPFNTSGFKGVTFDKQTQKWRAQISAKGKHFSLGRFPRKKDAAMAYNLAAKNLHGEFAYLNQIKK